MQIMRILLAEDDPMLGDGLRAGLRQLGFQVDWLRDGLAAERELCTAGYAAAVLDLGLPLKDGLEVLRSVRAKRITTPVLVLALVTTLFTCPPALVSVTVCTPFGWVAVVTCEQSYGRWE